jgi:hypothetical protein
VYPEAVLNITGDISDFILKKADILPLFKMH